MTKNKKKIKKNKYKTPASIQKKKMRLKGVIPFALIFSVLGLLTCLSALCITLIMAYSWVTQTSWFEAKKIEVAGINRLTEPEILKQADIRFGMNIFEMNLSLIRQRLMAHPWIKKAELIRIIPDKIEIKITEHRPHGTIAFNKKYIMNQEGEIFKHYSDDLSSLPVITGVLPDDINISGDSLIKPATKQHKAIMEILKIQTKAFMKISNKKVYKIHLDQELGLTLFSDGQIKKIKLGFGNYSEKFKKLEEVAKFVRKNDSLMIIETIDLVNIQRIVIKPANNSEKYNHQLIKPGGYNATT